MSVESINADATVVIAAFTVVLAVASIAQGCLTLIAVRQTREAFLASNRPKLRVRNVVVQPGDIRLVQSVGIIQPTQSVLGQFYVVNVGGSTARIIESCCIVDCRQGALPMKRPYEGRDADNQIAGAILAPGQSTVGTFLNASSLMPNDTSQIGERAADGWRLFIMGWIEYADDRNIRRRTSFCREFLKKNDNGRFYPVDDPDYEHEE